MCLPPPPPLPWWLQWLVARWIKHHGEAATVQLLQHNNQPPVYCVRANTAAGTTVPWLLQQCAELEPPVQATASQLLPNDFVRVRAGLQQLLRSGLVADGKVWRCRRAPGRVTAPGCHARTACAPAALQPPPGSIGLRRAGRQPWPLGLHLVQAIVQDEATGLVVQLLDPQPGDVILDTCAAPGGKAMFIASRLQGEVRTGCCAACRSPAATPSACWLPPVLQLAP